MKKIITLLVVFTMLIATTGQTFADIRVNTDIHEDRFEIMSNNRFRTVYEETPFQFWTSTITTESDVENTLKLAALELNALGFIVSGFAVKPVAGILTSGNRKQIIAVVTKYLPTMSVLSNSERILSAGLTFANVRAYKIDTERKFKYQYSENLSSGQRTLQNTWVTYRRTVYVREDRFSSWVYNGVEEITVRVR